MFLCLMGNVCLFEAEDFLCVCVLFKEYPAASFYLAEKKQCYPWARLLIFEFLQLHFHMYFSFPICVGLIQLN